MMSLNVVKKLRTTIGLCAGVALEFRPHGTAARLLIKINIKNQCLAMLVKPELKPGYAELIIAATSSRTCTKPIVVCSAISNAVYLFSNLSMSKKYLIMKSTSLLIIFHFLSQD